MEIELEQGTPLEDLAAWVDEQLAALPSGYRLKAWEYTVRSYHAGLPPETRPGQRTIYERLERLAQAGLLNKKQVRIGRNLTNVYWRSQDVPGEDGSDGD